MGPDEQAVFTGNGTEGVTPFGNSCKWLSFPGTEMYRVPVLM